MLILIYVISFQAQTTLTVVEEERDRFMTKLLNEEKTRKTLEGVLAMFLFMKKFHLHVVFECDFIPALVSTRHLYFATEQHQELEHSIATLKSEKSHVENQFKILQQKNEIMVEMYQQKENALQQ